MSKDDRFGGIMKIRRYIILFLICVVVIITGVVSDMGKTTVDVYTDTEGIDLKNIECVFSDGDVAGGGDDMEINYLENRIDISVEAYKNGECDMAVNIVPSDGEEGETKTVARYHIKVSGLRRISVEEIE